MLLAFRTTGPSNKGCKHLLVPAPLNSHMNDRTAHGNEYPDGDVRKISGGLFEVAGSCHVAGFIHETNNEYRALRGSDPHRAVELGRFSTWDGALLTVKVG